MVWIFGYGSLMWDSVVNNYRKNSKGPLNYGGYKASLKGYSRDLDLASIGGSWGVRGRKVPVWGMNPGGSCVGVAFDILDSEYSKIKRREGPGYNEQRVTITVDGVGKVQGIVFTTNNSNEKYIGDINLRQRAMLSVNSGKGSKGTGESYVKNAQAFLKNTLHVRDNFVDKYVKEIDNVKHKSISLQLPVYDNKSNMSEDQIGMPKSVRDKLKVSPNDYVIVTNGSLSQHLRVRKAPSELISGNSKSDSSDFVTISKAMRIKLRINSSVLRRSTPKFKSLFPNVIVKSTGKRFLF